MSTVLQDDRGNYEPKPRPRETTGQYLTPTLNGTPVFENAKQIIEGAGRIVGIYGDNSSADELYVLVADTLDGDNPAAGDGALHAVTVPNAGFVSIAGGQRFTRGLYVKAFTDPALTTPAGDVMAWNVQWSRV